MMSLLFRLVEPSSGAIKVTCLSLSLSLSVSLSLSLSLSLS
eukprot:COSAG03_NODE_5577_length_1216_cov_2.654432_1_plen_40_part_10